MPVDLKRKCKTPFCKNLHKNRSGYCDECEAKWKAKKAQEAAASDSRPSAQERGYDSQWNIFAADYKKRHPYCAICGAPTEVVDHKDMTADMMLEIYGHFIYDDDLYQPLCRRCNARKGAHEDKEKRAQFHKELDWLEDHSKL